jgi:hypothetical protein
MEAVRNLKKLLKKGKIILTKDIMVKFEDYISEEKVFHAIS